MGINGVIVQSQDDSAGVMCIVSLGFNSMLIPTNALITIAENAVNSPKFKITRFFAVAPKIFKEQDSKVLVLCR